MRRLGTAPTKDQLDQHRTTDFLQTIGERFNVYVSVNDPTVNDIPSGQWVFHKNTATGKVRLWTNDNGTLKSIYLGSTATDFLTDLGATAIGRALLTAATAAAARTTLGAGATGDILFTAATPAAARTTLGSGATGDTLFQAATAASARTTVLTGLVAFSAYQSVAQALTAAAFNKVQLQSKEFDPTNSFDSTTNYRFQPTVAGIYQISGRVGGTNSVQVAASIYKNGTEFKRGQDGTANYSSLVTALVSLNGTTDYVELWVYSQVAQNTTASAATVYFQGHYISP